MNRTTQMRTLDAGQPGGGWHQGAGRDDKREIIQSRLQVAKIGVRIFLAVVTSLFMLFLITYIARSQFADWMSISDPIGPLADTRPLWVNTTYLVLASIAIQCARLTSRAGNRRPTTVAIVLAGVLALAFVLGQLILWRRLAQYGFTVSTNPAVSFFYLLTGLHALHIVGGLVAWCRSMERVWRQQTMAEINAGIELCAIYWHYLLFIWALLFALLISPSETYATIAAICGLR